MDQADEQLLSLLATDLDYHFRQLVALYQQRLYGFALRLEGRPQDAEDIVQETFLRAYHALKSYPLLKVRALRLRQWLYTISLNIFRNRQIYRFWTQRPIYTIMTGNTFVSHSARSRLARRGP